MKLRAIAFLVLVLLLLVLMINLGFWQLRRYHAKQALLDQYHRNIAAAPLQWKDFWLEKPLFSRVIVSGNYVNDKTVLLDNRWHNSVLGYEVLTPFKVGSQYLLVNRGWIEAGNDRQQRPLIKKIVGEQTLQGYVVKPEKGFMIGDNIESPEEWPLRIQQIRLKSIAQATGLNFYPYVLRLLPDTANPQSLIREWQLVTVTPERHLGYAIQWFAMSLTLIIVYLIFLRRNQRGK